VAQQISNPFLDEHYRPLFSGHETFPLRYGWLKKAYDAVKGHEGGPATRNIFLDDDAIARFGVGKNMVTAIRHWAMACGMIALNDHTATLNTTELGDLILGSDGCDPYLEAPATLWLLHWILTSFQRVRPNKTTWYWTFNHYPRLDFARDDLVRGLLKLAEARGWQRVAPKTVSNDVDCLIRTYESRPSGRECLEDTLSSPLAELGLIRGLRGHFQLVRGQKQSLPNEIFAYALDEFWARKGAGSTLSFEAIAHESGSPGRAFLLDETDIAERLLALEEVTGGDVRWSETAGLKQVIRTGPTAPEQSMCLLRKAYHAFRQREAA
jgi:hypothetical protein